MIHWYHNMSKNEVKIGGGEELPADIEYQNNRQYMQKLFTERYDRTTLLGMTGYRDSN